MQQDKKADWLDWAKKPRSVHAWKLIMDCVAERDTRFEEIVIEHERQKRIIDGKPVKR